MTITATISTTKNKYESVFTDIPIKKANSLGHQALRKRPLAGRVIERRT